MNQEMKSMYSNKVWELVDAPNEVKPIGCKWIYKRKRGVDGRVEIFKARLVAEGFTQKEGINYEETFSPVAMLKSIRILLSIAAVLDYEIWQMDVKTAFLNRHLEENIYMQQPDGFIQKRPRTHDNILLIGNDIGVLTIIKIGLAKQFDMKDLEEISYILGIKLLRDRKNKTSALSQAVYIDKILARFSMENSKTGLLPFRHGITFSKDQSPKTSEEIKRMRRVPYAEAVGSLMYVMLCTRPDIYFAVGMTPQLKLNMWLHLKLQKKLYRLRKFLQDLEVVPAEPKSLQRKKPTRIFKLPHPPQFSTLIISHRQTHIMILSPRTFGKLARAATRPSNSPRLKSIKPLKDVSGLKDYLEYMYTGAAQYDDPQERPVNKACNGIDGALEGTDTLDRIFLGIVDLRGEDSCHDVDEFFSDATLDSSWG
ncbi:hypothetical protein WN944_018622 [Citrus x changshan-huyou]|uniref:Reverse transcriptase Ty1/copia-type domain-containing protein n=1 Tax=Citrus x changshan-huyou TaxID=2935761 RepID=A0AAP0LU08_9ROSI